MMGIAESQKSISHSVQIEDLVPADHPLRRIRPLVDAERIRKLCRPCYCEDNGRPSIPPEQLFFALLGGYLLGCRSDRVIIRQLTCDMAFRWFVGLDLDSPVWDASTFSKNRERRFDETNVMEQLFDDTVKTAIKKGWVSLHWSVDGTLTRANASQKSFAPIEVLERPEEYRKAISGKKAKDGRDEDGDKGYFARKFVQGLLDRKIAPHVSVKKKGRGGALMRDRMRERGMPFRWSQRCRKRIEELWGEAKELHGLRRFARRMVENVGQEALMIGWLLNLKRLATLQARATA